MNDTAKYIYITIFSKEIENDSVLFESTSKWSTSYKFEQGMVHFKVPRETLSFEFKCKNLKKNEWFFIKGYPIENNNNVFIINKLYGKYFSDQQLSSTFVSKSVKAHQEIFFIEKKIKKIKQKILELRNEEEKCNFEIKKLLDWKYDL